MVGGEKRGLGFLGLLPNISDLETKLQNPPDPPPIYFYSSSLAFSLSLSFPQTLTSISPNPSIHPSPKQSMTDAGSRDSIPPISAEEEALKRNTDCVYFLASPLTCKKGNECEYRHSEGARMNPRDCWYWLNGNCLNPKCLFRHPPLDSLLGTPGPTSTGASVLLQQTASSTQTHVAAQTTSGSFNSSKQTVPCFYFQKGHCLKGDKCPFLHGPNSVGNLVTPSPPSTLNVTSLAEPPQSLAKSNMTLRRCNSQQKIVVPNSEKSVEVLPPAIKPANKVEILPKDGLVYKKNVSPILLDNNRFVLKPVSAATNYENAGGIPHNHPFQHLEDPCQNKKEADEFLRESSPGFDVLVDDELESSEYYHNVDESGRNPVHGGRRHEFDFHLDHDSVAEFEGEPFNDFDDSDQYARGHKELGWGRSHRASSERTLERSSIYSKERRGVLRPGVPDQIDRSDLRYRLSKQRRVNGSRLSTSPDRHSEFYRRDERYIEDHRRGSHSRRESRHPPREISISSRLQGRLKLPERPLPDNTDDFHADRENERGRSWGRSSPSRPLSLYQGKHHLDRIKRTQEFSIEGSNSRGPLIGRNEAVDTPNFAGPKRLAELKGVKISDPVEEQSSKSSSSTMKLGKVVGHQEPEDSLSFEGPKPLSVILKRKRKVSSGDGAESSSKEESSQRQRVDVRVPVESENVVETENGDEGLLTTKGEEFEHVVGDEMLRETMEEEDQEYEAQDQQEGEVEYEYETTDGVEFKTEDENVDQEDGNVDPEEEYLDDEDGDDDDDDDFARKIGVMMS